MEDPRDAGVADLFHQLVENGQAVVRAEINLYREIAFHRVAKAKSGLIALLIGAVLALGALITLLVMAAIALATLIGPLAAGLVVAFVLLSIAFILVRSGIKGMSALGGDEEEKAALKSGERA